MEDYHEFIQRCASCPSKNIDSNNRSPSTTSVIRFYGRPILPPLLTEEKREEMQQHREEAQTAAVHRRTKDAVRRARVHGTPPRDQLCKTPTHEVFPHEPKSDEKSPSSPNSSGEPVLQSSPLTGANNHLLFSSPPEEKGEDESPTGHLEDYNLGRHGGFPDYPDSSAALNTNHSLTADPGTQNADLGGGERLLGQLSELLQEGGTRSSTEKSHVTKSLLVPSPSESKATHSAFYASPQLEPQEKCLINQDTGQQASNPNCPHGLSRQSAIHDDLQTTTNVCRGSVDGTDRDMFGSLEGAHDEGSLFPHSPSNTTAKMPSIICYPPLDGDEFEHSGLESWLGYGFIISKGISHSLVMPDPLVEEKSDLRLHSTERKDDPCLPPLISHNKDHNLELLENHPLPNGQRDPAATRPDKVNPRCVTLQALLKRSQEYRQHQQMLRNKGKNREVREKTPEPTRVRTCRPGLSGKRKDESLAKRSETTSEGKPKEKESTFTPAEEAKEFWEKDGMTESQVLCNLTKSENTEVQEDGRARETGKTQEETTAENGTERILEEITMKPQPASSSPQQRRKGSRKYRMTRAAIFWKSTQDSEPGADVGDNSYEEQQQVNEAACDRLAKGPQQIDLIESSLCGLKAQILDLESTLKENLEGHSPEECDMLLDLEYVQDKLHVQAFQSDRARLSHGVTNSVTKCLRRQLLKDMVDTEENPGPGPSHGHDDPLGGRKEPWGFNSEEPGEEEVLAGRRVLHGAQQDQIPEVFQTLSSETDVLSDSLVFSNTRNHPGGENEAAAGCSYCDPRFLQGSGSELASEGPPRPENHLTPERGGEFQGGFSRVKLLTHFTSEADWISPVASRGQGPALGPSPSARTWIFPGQGSQKCSQAQSAAHRPEGDGSGDEEEQQKQVLVAGVERLPEQQQELPQPGSAPPEHFRPLLPAAEMGFLSHALLRTETMLIPSQDGEPIHRGELREESMQTGRPRRKSCLSAATQKSLERKRERLLAAIKSKAVTQGQLKANCVRF